MEKLIEEYRSHILVVEDNKITAQLIRRYLKDAGYNTIALYNGQELIEKLESDSSADAIVLDLMMPKIINGYEACKRIKENPQTKNIPVILMSMMFLERAYQEQAIEAGAYDFMLKPVVEKVLLAKVKNAVEYSCFCKYIYHLQDLVLSS
ncbi:MAG: response regulator [bacterium]